MRSRTRSNGDCIDVYASATIDIRNGEPSIGGPLYYAYRALKGETRVRFALRDASGFKPVTIFFIGEEKGVKRLRLVAHSYWRDCLPYCSAALYAPVYHEFPLHLLYRACMYKFCIIDLQGYTRYGREHVTRRLVSSIAKEATAAWNCAVKLSIDDVSSVSELEKIDARKLNYILLTANEYGVVALDLKHGVLASIKVKPLPIEAIGAGDMLNALILAYQLKGLTFIDAVVKAVRDVEEILSRESSMHTDRADVQTKKLPCTSCYLNELISLIDKE